MFYVSVKRRPSDEAGLLVLGPFVTHGGALARVDTVRRVVRAEFRDGHWLAFGTARHSTSHEPGRLNDLCGYDGPGRLP